MKNILFCAIPFNKDAVTLALESGVDGIIVEESHLAITKELSKIPAYPVQDFIWINLNQKTDEIGRASCRERV